MILVLLGNGHEPIAGLDRLVRAAVLVDQREVELDRLPQGTVAGVQVRHVDQVIEHLFSLRRDRLILIVGLPAVGGMTTGTTIVGGSDPAGSSSSG